MWTDIFGVYLHVCAYVCIDKHIKRIESIYIYASRHVCICMHVFHIIGIWS